MEGTADAVQVLDLKGRLLHLNGPAMVRLEIVDFAGFRGADWVRFGHRSRARRCEQAVAEALRGSGMQLSRCCVQIQTGHANGGNIAVSPVRESATGQIVRILAVSRDVTELRGKSSMRCAGAMNRRTSSSPRWRMSCAIRWPRSETLWQCWAGRTCPTRNWSGVARSLIARWRR